MPSVAGGPVPGAPDAASVASTARVYGVRDAPAKAPPAVVFGVQFLLLDLIDDAKMLSTAFSKLGKS